MRCPQDGSELTMREVHGVEVHVCEHDGGMFLEEGQLNKVAEPTQGDLEFSTVDLDSFEHEDSEGPLLCPKDPDVQMKKAEFIVHTNIILDYCETCHGFWLDGKELQRINEEVAELNAASKEVPDPPMLWFAKFIWSLPFPH